MLFQTSHCRRGSGGALVLIAILARNSPLDADLATPPNTHRRRSLTGSTVEAAPPLPVLLDAPILG